MRIGEVQIGKSYGYHPYSSAFQGLHRFDAVEIAKVDVRMGGYNPRGVTRAVRQVRGTLHRPDGKIEEKTVYAKQLYCTWAEAQEGVTRLDTQYRERVAQAKRDNALLDALGFRNTHEGDRVQVFQGWIHTPTIRIEDLREIAERFNLPTGE